ncbi:MAG: hypothetical protein LBC64_07580 [Fibromonadaceae bacterium]|jgi:predicted double-glycine peptidase|nr:hypothetical protein [Fibromonadaceae bacterium]
MKKKNSKIPFSVYRLLKHFLTITEHIKAVNKYVPDNQSLNIAFDEWEYNEIIEFVNAISANRKKQIIEDTKVLNLPLFPEQAHLEGEI